MCRLLKTCVAALMAMLLSTQSLAQCIFPIALNATNLKFNTNSRGQACETEPISIVDSKGVPVPLRFVAQPACPKKAHYRIDAFDADGKTSFSLLVDGKLGAVLDCNGLLIASIYDDGGWFLNAQRQAIYFDTLVIDPNRAHLAWVFSATATNDFFTLQDDHYVDIASANNTLPDDKRQSSWVISFNDGAATPLAKNPSIMLSVTIMKQLASRFAVQSDKGLSAGAIAGIVVGIAVCLVVVATCAAVVIGIRPRCVVPCPCASCPCTHAGHSISPTTETPDQEDASRISTIMKGITSRWAKSPASRFAP